MEWVWKQKTEVLREWTVADVPFLTFPTLDGIGSVIDGFSTRLGGVSEGEFAAMNFTFTRSDNPAHVTENYRGIAKALGMEVERMVLSYQTYAANTRVIAEENTGRGVVKERDCTDADGMITSASGITSVIFYADCALLYSLDTVHKATGLNHSGWRGTVDRAERATMEVMVGKYGPKPEDMAVCVGPSIRRSYYEVEEEVAQDSREAFKAEYWPELLGEKAGGKYQLNLWRANKVILLEVDIRPEHIQVTGIRTHCNPELPFSYRACGDERGNLAASLHSKQ